MQEANVQLSLLECRQDVQDSIFFFFFIDYKLPPFFIMIRVVDSRLVSF